MTTAAASIPLASVAVVAWTAEEGPPDAFGVLDDIPYRFLLDDAGFPIAA
jgi:hypothetical protein